MLSRTLLSPTSEQQHALLTSSLQPSTPSTIMTLYTQVSALKASNVVVMYASAYGNTAALAQAISRGLVKGGVAVKTINLEVRGQLIIQSPNCGSVACWVAAKTSRRRCCVGRMNPQPK